MSGLHWHHACMEPPEGDKGGQFRFNPDPKTVVEAKSELLPIILAVAAGPVVSLPDLHHKSAKLATQWLCSEDKGITVAGYLFAVLECEGNYKATYVAFQRMVQDLWRNAGRKTRIVTTESNKN